MARGNFPGPRRPRGGPAPPRQILGVIPNLPLLVLVVLSISTTLSTVTVSWWWSAMGRISC
jgi:hypothetical protein